MKKKGALSKKNKEKLKKYFKQEDERINIKLSSNKSK